MSDVFSKLSLIKFQADWCGSCKKMEPTIKILEYEFEDIEFISVDIDDNTELVSKYGIKSIPTLVLCEDGKEITRVVGLSLLGPLRKLLRTTEEKYQLKDKNDEERAKTPGSEQS